MVLKLLNADKSKIDLNNLQLPKINGIYTLSIFHESGEIETLKFIKKDN